MNRILFAADEIDRPLAPFDPRLVHLRTVLKAQVGDTVAVGVIDGPIGTATVTAIGRDGAVLACRWEDQAGPPLLPITCVLGHPRPLVLKRVIRDLCSVGVGRLIVCNSDLSERSYFASSLWQGDTVRDLLIDGASIAGAVRLTEVVRAESTAAARALVAEEGVALRLVLDEALHNRADSVVGFDAAPPPAVAVAVGCERGWTAAERAGFVADGWVSAGLGPRVLRTETSVTAICTLLALWYHRSTSDTKTELTTKNSK
ncbi:MAG: RsmE family RNA methyltransferase [Spirochaetaceae bacterium]|nr:MAG: RsmE family RNA methyltransferase [Spirochaetaceae bacterium]